MRRINWRTETDRREKLPYEEKKGVVEKRRQRKGNKKRGM